MGQSRLRPPRNTELTFYRTATKRKKRDKNTLIHNISFKATRYLDLKKEIQDRFN